MSTLWSHCSFHYCQCLAACQTASFVIGQVVVSLASHHCPEDPKVSVWTKVVWLIFFEVKDGIKKANEQIAKSYAKEVASCLQVDRTTLGAILNILVPACFFARFQSFLYHVESVQSMPLGGLHKSIVKKSCPRNVWTREQDFRRNVCPNEMWVRLREKLIQHPHAWKVWQVAVKTIELALILSGVIKPSLCSSHPSSSLCNYCSSSCISAVSVVVLRGGCWPSMLLGFHFYPSKP